MDSYSNSDNGNIEIECYFAFTTLRTKNKSGESISVILITNIPFSFDPFQFGFVRQGIVSLDHAVIQIVGMGAGGERTEHVAHIPDAADHEPDHGDHRDHPADGDGDDELSPSPP